MAKPASFELNILFMDFDIVHKLFCNFAKLSPQLQVKLCLKAELALISANPAIFFKNRLAFNSVFSVTVRHLHLRAIVCYLPGPYKNGPCLKIPQTFNMFTLHALKRPGFREKYLPIVLYRNYANTD